MIQLVELVTVDNEDLAYHYASDNVDEVFNCILQNRSTQLCNIIIHSCVMKKAIV